MTAGMQNLKLTLWKIRNKMERQKILQKMVSSISQI
jgi:hypothetical protein